MSLRYLNVVMVILRNIILFKLLSAGVYKLIGAKSRPAHCVFDRVQLVHMARASVLCVIHDGMKLWLKEKECQTFEETQAFPIQTYHICNARLVYITLHSFHGTWKSIVCVLIRNGGRM